VIPALLIRVELEGSSPSVQVIAESYEDEQALRAWVGTRRFHRFIWATFRSLGREAPDA